MNKKYELQYLKVNSIDKKLKVWKKMFRSDNLETLKLSTANKKYRIVDSETKDIIWEHDSSDEK